VLSLEDSVVRACCEVADASRDKKWPVLQKKMGLLASFSGRAKLACRTGKCRALIGPAATPNRGTSVCLGSDLLPPPGFSTQDRCRIREKM
jgi:hypothetical protein